MADFYFFSKNLKTYLFAQEMTKEELAAKLGLGAPSTVGKWISENRPPKGASMKLLTDLMGFTDDEIINEDLTWRIIQKSHYTDLSFAEEPAAAYQIQTKKIDQCLDFISSLTSKIEEMASDSHDFLTEMR